MMVEHHDHFRTPQQAKCTRVAVYDDFGNPVCLVVSIQPGHVQAYRIGDEDFEEQCRQHGLHHTVMLTEINSTKIGPKTRQVDL